MPIIGRYRLLTDDRCTSISHYVEKTTEPLLLLPLLVLLLMGRLKLQDVKQTDLIAGMKLLDMKM